MPIAAAAVGILLLIFGTNGEKDSKKVSVQESSFAEPENTSATEFASATERKICTICEEIVGVGKVRAVVTLDGGYRAVYASDVQGSDSSYRNETVLTGSGNSEQAILVGYESPRIVGIGIVCEGGDDPNVRQSIIRLVSAAFDVGAHKIYVVGGE